MDIVHRIWKKYLGVNTPAAELAKEASAEIERLKSEIDRLNECNAFAVTEGSKALKQLATAKLEGFNEGVQAASHKLIDGKYFVLAQIIRALKREV